MNIMNKLMILFSIMVLISCGKTKKTKLKVKEKKQIEVNINRTIETFLILRSISDDDPLFQYRDSTYRSRRVSYAI